MALHAPYATVLWDYINRGMPFRQEGSLKPDEVYSLTAFLLYKNGVIQEEELPDTGQSEVIGNHLLRAGYRAISRGLLWPACRPPG
jgi:hypothetical protein